MQSVPDAGAATALELAGIRPERQGRRRLSGLTQPERELYRWILHRFAAAAPPSGQATRTTARELALDPDEVLGALARDDLVHTDHESRPVVAYPFSARDRGHRVLIDEIHEVEAMCAIDALGIAPMLGLPIRVAHAFGRFTASAQPCCLSERERTDANACTKSTSWGSLVRAQYRPSKNSCVTGIFFGCEGCITSFVARIVLATTFGADSKRPTTSGTV
jgi:hypothetical protein